MDSKDNARDVDVIHTNTHLWRSVGGPDPEDLFRPTAAKLELCRQVSERLGEVKEKDNRDGVQEFCDELRLAVETLKSLEWNDIRIEKYNMTPPALFSELARPETRIRPKESARPLGGRVPVCVPHSQVRVAESLLVRQSAETAAER